jgi:hypothetical protein
MHFRPAFGSVIEQHLVEIGSRDLISVIGLRTEPVLKIKFGSPLGTRSKDFAAEFSQETGARKFFVQLQPAKRFHAEGQKRFANMKAWKFFALKYDHSSSSTREQRSGGAASRSSANDCDVVHVDLHSGNNLIGESSCLPATD